jgi:hypothetical protein
MYYENKTHIIQVKDSEVITAIHKPTKSFVKLDYKHIKMVFYKEITQTSFERCVNSIKYLKTNRIFNEKRNIN